MENCNWVKKTSLGYVNVDKEDNATNIVLEKSAYRFYQNRISELENKIKLLNIELSEKMHIYRMAMEGELIFKEDVEDKESEVEELKAKNAKLEEELKQFEGINANYIRQIKERNNAARGIVPKKVHTGYALVGSNPKEVRRFNKEKVKSLIIYETILQSPFELNFSYEEAYKLICSDIEKNKVLKLIGFEDSFFKGDLDGVIKLGKKRNKSCFNLLLRANGKMGYWEASFQHLVPIEAVPEILMFPKKKKKSGIAISIE